MTIALNPNPPGGPALVSHPPQTRASTCNATIAAVAKKSLSLLSIKPTRNQVRCFTFLAWTSLAISAYYLENYPKEVWALAAYSVGLICSLIAQYVDKRIEEAPPPLVPLRPKRRGCGALSDDEE